jgi:tetratricopeptide (TPR) repeat protein
MNKKVEPLFSKDAASYLGTQKIMIVHPSPLVRQLVRKTLSSPPVSNSNIELCAIFEEAKDKILLGKPRVIICAGQVDGKRFTDLFNYHLQVYPNRLQASFIVIENDNSPSVVIRDMSYDIDGVISEPLSLSSIAESLGKIINPKISPTDLERQFEEGKVLFRNKNYAEALEHFENSCLTDPVNSLYYIANINYMLGEKDKLVLINTLKEALVFNPKHYRSLDLLSKIYMEEKLYDKAYDVFHEMTRWYPINPECIPSIIRVSIYQKKYDEVLALSNFFATLEKQPSEINRSMAAGLAVCAKYLYEVGELKKALELFRKAAVMSNGSVNIIKNIAKNLIAFGKAEQAEEILASVKESGIAAEEYEAILLEIFLNSYPPEKTLLYAHNLLKNNLYHPYFYEVAFYCAHSINRPNIADDIYFRATKMYPEMKSKLDRIKAG